MKTVFALAFSIALISGLGLAATRREVLKSLPPSKDTHRVADLNLPPKADSLRSQISPTAELHGIGVYEGGDNESNCTLTSNPNRETKTPIASPCYQEHQQGNVDVKISKTNRSLVLFLTAYEPVKWNIIQEPGVKIEYIILSGYHSQDVAGISPTIPILKRSYKEADIDYFYVYNDDSQPRYLARYDEQQKKWVCSEREAPQDSNYLRTARRLQEITGLDIASIQGSYERKAFEIGDSTKGNYLVRAREGGYCYRNAAGELEEGRDS